MIVHPMGNEAQGAGERIQGEAVAREKPIRVELAGNEFEPVQVVIEAPAGQDLPDVAVTLGPLRQSGSRARTWPRDDISLWRVGEVEVYDLWEPHQSLGWYPDPLLPLREPLTLDAGQRLTVWVRFFACSQLPSGTYQGELEVASAGKVLRRLPVEVTLWDFTVPTEQHFTLSIPIWGGHLEAMYPGSQTPERRRAYLDMLYDHRVAPFPLDENEIEHAMERGVRDFNLACFPRDGISPETAQGVGKTAARRREKGWDRRAGAYVLLGDEAPRECYPYIQEQGRLVGELAPSVARRFTVHDQMFGQVPWIVEQMRDRADTVIHAAAHCYPVDSLTRSFRDAGFGVWWYHVAEHFYIPSGGGSQMAQGRLALWRHWEYQVPGQLHWGMTYWGDANIAGQDGRKWPDIPWDTKGSRGGDGYLVYPAPGGEACWPSLRLEQLRDGVEDYEYFILLKDLTEGLEKQSQRGRGEKIAARLEENRRLLALDDALVKTYTEYDHRPEAYRDYRRRLAKAIVATERYEGPIPPR
jgi:hypothetical protein